VPLAYGVTWVRGIQVYSGEPFVWYEGTAGAPAMLVPVYTTDKTTGDVSIEEEAQACQSAVLVLCERATTILDIIKDGVSINSGMLDNDPITTVTQRLRMLSGRIPSPAGIIPPTGEEHGYFHGGTGAAVAHTRFSRAANLGAAPYTYSSVARVDFCALGIGTRSSRPSLQFKVQALLAASATVGAHPADVLVDLWTRAGKDPAKIDVETYYRAYVTGGGGSGSTEWRVSRTIDSQTSARDLMDALLDETFSTVVKKENGTIMVVPRDVASGTATAIGVNDFVPGGGQPVTVELKQASDCFNCVPVTYEVTAPSGSHTVTNEDTTFAVANPFSATETIRRAPTVATKWVSTAEHALNLSHLLARESFTGRATYKFRLHKRWVLLQEHDLLSLMEPHLGLSAKVVKIRRISEDESGVISIEADEWFGQVTYTTPEVDPFDGFEPLPGNPVDPTVAAVIDMADDGKLTPAEKPAFYSAVLSVWHGVREGDDAGTGDILIHGTALNDASLDFYNYLQTIGFTYAWVDIDRVWTDAGDRTTQRALLAAWMAETTDVVAADYRAAFDAVTTAIADARAYVLKPTAAGSSTARTLMVRMADVTNVLDFSDDGVDPDGTTDSTAGFAAAAAACAANGGGDLIIPAGEYLLADLPSVSGVRWVGQGPGRTKLKRLNAGGSEAYLIKFNGTVGSTSNLTANAAAGAFSVAVGNGALWAAGDWALIRESTYVATTVGRKQQILRVASVSTNTVYFDRPLLEGYFTTATAQLCVLSPIVDAGIYDMALEGVNASGSGAIVRAQYAVGLRIEGVVAQWFSTDAAYSFSTCLDSHLRGVVARDGVDVATGGKGWGASFDEACSFCSIEDSTFENVREVAFTNRTSWSRFRGNRVLGSYDSGINTHGSFVTHCDIDDNQIVGVRQGVGIALGYATHQAGDQFINVRRNTVRGYGSYGIIANAPSDKPHKHIRFEGNRVYPMAADYGMAAVYTEKFHSLDNVIDFEGGAGNTGYYLVGVTRARLRGDWVRDATGTYGFRHDTCTDVDFDACETDSLDAGMEYQADGTNTRVTVRRGTPYTP
jgi:hypothetical protein